MVEGREFAPQPFLHKAHEFFKRIVSRTVDPASGLALDFEKDFWSTAYVPSAQAITTWKPKAILAVGQNALQSLTGRTESIDVLRGYVFEGPGRIPVIGTYHPVQILKGKFHLARVVKLDLLKTVEIARQGVPRRQTDYILNPSPMDLLEFVQRYEKALEADPSIPLCFDIETPYVKKAEKDDDPYDFEIEDDASYTILQISFSFEEGKAITFAWREPFIGLAKRLLASRGAKVSFNGISFDIPRLEANQAPVNGDIIDAMHAWKCLEPALPMSLRFVVSVLLPDVELWKLEVRERPEFYSASDSDLLLRVYNKIAARLKAEGRWEMFLRHFVKCGTILKRMTQRGIRVNIEKRQKAREVVEGWLKEKEAQVQEVVPTVCRPRKVFKLPLETLEKKGYSRDSLILVDDEVVELKKGWRLSSEGYLEREPKPPKVKKEKPVKIAKKAKPRRSSSKSTKQDQTIDSPLEEPTSGSAISALLDTSLREAKD